MARKTSEALATEVRLLLNDPDATRYGDDLVADVITSALRFTQGQIMSRRKRAMVEAIWSFKLLRYGNFSYDDEIDLPSDFLYRIKLQKEGGDQDDFVKFVSFEDIGIDDGDNDIKSRGCVYPAPATVPVADSGNSGLDDISVWPDYTGAATLSYVIEMQSANTYRWSDDGGSTWDASNVTCTTDWADLNNGLMVKFAAVAGHTSGDKWTFTAYHDRQVKRLQLNFNPGANWKLWYVKKVTEISSIANTVFLPYEDFYDAIKLFTHLMLLSYDEQDVNLDITVYRPVIKRMNEIITNLNYGQSKQNRPNKSCENYT